MLPNLLSLFAVSMLEYILCLLCTAVKSVLADMQVPRILNPVVLVVDGLPELCKDQQVKGYVESMFGSVEQCRYITGDAKCCYLLCMASTL